MRCDYIAFLNENAEKIGVLLVEPQSGSSLSAMPWPQWLLKDYISLAQARGIKVRFTQIYTPEWIPKKKKAQKTGAIHLDRRMTRLSTSQLDIYNILMKISV